MQQEGGALRWAGMVCVCVDVIHIHFKIWKDRVVLRSRCLIMKHGAGSAAAVATTHTGARQCNTLGTTTTTTPTTQRMQDKELGRLMRVQCSTHLQHQQVERGQRGQHVGWRR